MPFRFSLEPLLRYRRSVEEQQRLRLLVVARGLTACRAQLATIEQGELDLRRRSADQMRSGLFGAEIQFVEDCLRAVEPLLAELRLKILELQRDYEKQQSVVVQERQKREILEKIRDRELEAYKYQRQRREQAMADETFLITRRSNAGRGFSN